MQRWILCRCGAITHYKLQICTTCYITDTERLLYKSVLLSLLGVGFCAWRVLHG